jgi:hypothetical protein
MLGNAVVRLLKRVELVGHGQSVDMSAGWSAATAAGFVGLLLIAATTPLGGIACKWRRKGKKTASHGTIEKHEQTRYTHRLNVILMVVVPSLRFSTKERAC